MSIYKKGRVFIAPSLLVLSEKHRTLEVIAEAYFKAYLREVLEVVKA